MRNTVETVYIQVYFMQILPGEKTNSLIRKPDNSTGNGFGSVTFEF